MTCALNSYCSALRIHSPSSALIWTLFPKVNRTIKPLPKALCLLNSLPSTLSHALLLWVSLIVSSWYVRHTDDLCDWSVASASPVPVAAPEAVALANTGILAVSRFRFDKRWTNRLRLVFVARGSSSSRSSLWTRTYSWRVRRCRGQGLPLWLPVIESVPISLFALLRFISAPLSFLPLRASAVQLDADHHWHTQPQFDLLRWPFRTIFWIPFSYARYEFVLLIGRVL